MFINVDKKTVLNVALRMTGEPHLAETGRKIFVVVIPKGGLTGTGPAKPSFGMTPTIELDPVLFTDYILYATNPTKCFKSASKVLDPTVVQNKIDLE